MVLLLYTSDASKIYVHLQSLQIHLFRLLGNLYYEWKQPN